MFLVKVLSVQQKTTEVYIKSGGDVCGRVNSNIIRMMMCPNRFLNCNKCTTVVGKVDNGEAMPVPGQRVCGKPA